MFEQGLNHARRKIEFQTHNHNATAAESDISDDQTEWQTGLRGRGSWLPVQRPAHLLIDGRPSRSAQASLHETPICQVVQRLGCPFRDETVNVQLEDQNG